MTKLDVSAVLAIEQAVQAYPWTRGNFLDALSSGYLCYVDENAGKICSFSVLMPGVEEAELLNIAVAAAHQRKGLGAAMLGALLALAAAKQWQRVFLEVRATNHAALTLYQRTGFSQIGLRRGYYRNEQNCEDAIVMAWELSGKSNG